jgi:hypothetical protein
LTVIAHSSRPIRLGALVALTCVAATAALAHDTWLLPASLRVPVGRAVELSLTSGMAFPADDFAIRPDRVVRAESRLAGRTAPLPTPRAGRTALRYRWTPRAPGVAALVVELAPRRLDLTAKQIDEYLDEIGAPAELRDAWRRRPEPKRWREEYAKHATTFVRVGAPDASDTTWRVPLGAALEIVPERDPTALRAGDTLAVRVLRAGAPAAGFVVGARREGETTPAFARTDAAGRALIPLPRAGRWLLAGTDLRPVSEPDLTWRSDFATVTLAVEGR